MSETAVFMIKKCKDCGAEYEGSRNSRFCISCRRKRAKAGRIKRREQMKESLSFARVKPAAQKEEAKKVFCDVTQCRKCLYRLDITANEIGCGHLYYTGKMRPSEPSPNCTAFEKTDRKKRAKLLGNINTPPAPMSKKSGIEKQYSEYTAEVIERERKILRKHKRERG